jgi:lipopolysaccharide/colanic/teichoic acid biosynthesis glycosyltransferase
MMVFVPAGHQFYRARGKRLLDLAIASAALAIAVPVMAVIAAAILCVMGAPVLHADLRAGRGGHPFVLRKFRTMTSGVDPAGQLLPDEDRLTALGRMLRRTSLDELPQLVHVIRGEMSLVGPRPLPVRYVERYSPAEARRLEVFPGLTGLAQVRGRNGLHWARRFELDVEYVDRVSLAQDLRILAATLVVVLRGRGVSQPGHATAEEFSPQVR